MFKHIVAALFALLLSAPAFGAPGYSGQLISGVKTDGRGTGQQVVYATDFSGRSDDLGSFDLRLDAFINISQDGQLLTMRANIDPVIATRFKTIIQTYHITVPVAVVGDRTVRLTVTDGISSQANFPLTRISKLRVYRISHDGGRTWSRLETRLNTL